MKFLRKAWKFFRRKEKVLVLDTSALETKGTMKIIEKASKVVLLTGTIREMDKYKDAGGNLGDNIRTVSRKSREDEKSKKYICVAGYEKNHYQDDNIIEYCRKNKNAIILTNDNNLCNIAKAYGISYIFPESEGLQNIKGVIIKDGVLYLSKGENKEIAFVVRKEEVIQESLNYEIKLQVGDIIYKVKHKDGFITVFSYEIKNMESSKYAQYVFSLKIESGELNKVKDNQLPRKVKEQIFFLLEEKEQKIKEEKREKAEVKDSRKKEEQDACKEVFFYHNYIRVVSEKHHKKYIKVERNGKLIQIKDYKEGDILYVLDYYLNNKFLKVKVYNIEKKDESYIAQKESENIIWYINEIFRSNFSKEMQEVIWKIYMKYCGY